MKDCVYFIDSFKADGQTYKLIGRFVPVKTLALRINHGGYEIKEEDSRSFEELKAMQNEWILGLEVVGGNYGAILIRGKDLYPTMSAVTESQRPCLSAAEAILQDMPIAETKFYRDGYIPFYYDTQSKQFIPKVSKDLDDIPDMLDYYFGLSKKCYCIV